MSDQAQHGSRGQQNGQQIDKKAAPASAGGLGSPNGHPSGNVPPEASQGLQQPFEEPGFTSILLGHPSRAAGASQSRRKKMTAAQRVLKKALRRFHEVFEHAIGQITSSEELRAKVSESMIEELVRYFADRIRQTIKDHQHDGTWNDISCTERLLADLSQDLRKRLEELVEVLVGVRK